MRHVAGMGEMKDAHKHLPGILKEKGHVRDLGIDGRIIK
jgi:hypothetical protein